MDMALYVVAVFGVWLLLARVLTGAWPWGF